MPLDRLLDLGAAPDDSADLRAQKRLQVAMALLSLPAIGAWGLSFVPFGRVDVALLLCLGYCLGTVLLLGHLGMTRAYGFFSVAHPLLVLLGPVAMQLWLGGFVGSGGALLWSFIAPVAAMMFVGSRASVAMFVALVGLAALSWEPRWMGITGAPLAPRAIRFYFAFNGLGLAAFVFFSTRDFVTRLNAEHARSEGLLRNILPGPIAERLKTTPGPIAERYPAVSVVFSDLVGFTRLSAHQSPVELVGLLNEVFSAFDGLAERLGLEKIKTIGDAYMVVAGLPTPCADHADRCAEMALGMRDALAEIAGRRDLELQMRLGIHSGEVVAGVIGCRKFSYDLWGDTVNTASRMESHGAAGRVQVSEATAGLLGPRFAVTERGVIEVKGKGPMRVFWIDGLRPHG